jgi:hypothetical protein
MDDDLTSRLLRRRPIGTHRMLSISAGQTQHGEREEYLSEVSILRVFRAVALATTIAVAALLTLAAAPAAAKPLTWSLTPVQPVPQDGVPSEISGESCPGTNLCVAVTVTGDILTSTDPSGGVSDWSESDVDGVVGIDAVSCPTTGLCVADDASGDILTSTDPGTSGVGNWTITPVGWTGVSISCQSTALCLAGDENGNIYESVDPTGGMSAWAGVHVDSRPVISLSCPLSTLCVGGDDNGNVLVSDNPAGQSWTLEHVDAVDPITSMGCTPDEVCVGTDLNGDVVTTDNPNAAGGDWQVTQIDATSGSGIQL